MRVVLIAFFCQTLSASANPRPDPGEAFRSGSVVALTLFAIAMEVIVVTKLLGLAADIERKALLWWLIIGLNVATFTVFIMVLHRWIRSVTVIELLVVVSETYAMMRISSELGTKPLTFRQCLVISLIGNVVSYVIGMSAS